MADRTYTNFKSKLTRLRNAKDHTGVIALWAEFQAHYENHNQPLPDAYARWEVAAEDARLSLLRSAPFEWLRASSPRTVLVELTDGGFTVVPPKGDR